MSLKEKSQNLNEVFKRIGPIVAIIGLVAGLIVDVLAPLAHFAKYLLGVSILIAIIIFVGPLRKQVKEYGFETAFSSKAGGQFIFALGNVLVWMILTILSIYAPQEGFLASNSDWVKSFQKSVLNIEANIHSSQQTLHQAEQTMNEIQAALNQGEQGLKADPKTAQDFYTNAKLYQLNGSLAESKQAFLEAFKLGFPYVDAHENFLQLMINSEGTVAVRKIYQEMIAAQGAGADSVLLLMDAKLAETREERIKFHQNLISSQKDFAPAYVSLAKEYEAIGLGKLSSLEAVKIKEALETFERLDAAGQFAKYYLDKSVMDEGRSAINKLKQTYTIFKKEAVAQQVSGNAIKIEAHPAGATTTFTLMPPDAYYSKILFSIDDVDHFQETGFFDFEHPMTKQKMAKTMTDPVKVSKGKHIVYVKYIDLNGNESGVSQQEFTVP